MGFTNFKVRTIITTDSMNVSGNAVFVWAMTLEIRTFYSNYARRKSTPISCK